MDVLKIDLRVLMIRLENTNERLDSPKIDVLRIRLENINERLDSTKN